MWPYNISQTITSSICNCRNIFIYNYSLGENRTFTYNLYYIGSIKLERSNYKINIDKEIKVGYEAFLQYKNKTIPLKHCSC